MKRFASFGTGLLLLALIAVITGIVLLPFYRATAAGAHQRVAENVPVVGPMQARLLRGGSDAVSPQTLSLWYVAHIALLPLALAVFVGLFVTQVRRAGARLAFSWTTAAVMLVILLLMGASIP